jgi:hypothetical protein
VYELIPILTGVTAGVAALRLEGTRARAALIAAAAAAAALVAGLASGELAESPLFFFWDLAQGIAAAAFTIVVVSRWRERARAR